MLLMAALQNSRGAAHHLTGWKSAKHFDHISFPNLSDDISISVFILCVRP